MKKKSKKKPITSKERDKRFKEFIKGKELNSNHREDFEALLKKAVTGKTT